MLKKTYLGILDVASCTPSGTHFDGRGVCSSHQFTGVPCHLLAPTPFLHAPSGIAGAVSGRDCVVSHLYIVQVFSADGSAVWISQSHRTEKGSCHENWPPESCEKLTKCNAATAVPYV
jgi:hypothetical protein